MKFLADKATLATHLIADFFEHWARDLQSFRVLFNILYLSLYVFLCIWAALYYAPTSLNTAIVATSGIVASIFTGYIWSTTKEKSMRQRPVSHAALPDKAPEEEGASD